MRRTKKTKKTRMQGHMAVAISMAMAAGLALTGCGSTGTTGVSAETSAEVKMKPGGILPVTQQADRKKVRVGLALRR